LGSQTGVPQLLYTSVPDNFQASTSPVIATDGTIYIGFNNVSVVSSFEPFMIPSQGTLVAFNSNGNVKWQFTLNTNDTFGSSNQDITTVNGSSTPAIGSDGTIYFGASTTFPESSSSSTSVYAVRPDGTLRWSQSFTPSNSVNNDTSTISSSLAIGNDGNIYFGCFSTNTGGTTTYYTSLFSISASTGDTNWEYRIDNGKITNSVAIDDYGNIYFNCITYDETSSALLYSLASNMDVRQIWNLNNENTTDNFIPYGRPVLSTNQTVVYSISYYSTGNIYLYSMNTQDYSQTLLKTIPFESNIYGFNNSMARDNNDNIYFSFFIPPFSAIFSVKDNTINWSFPFIAGEEVLSFVDSTPVIGSDGTIYVGFVASDLGYANTTNSYYMTALNPDGTLKWMKLVPGNNAYLFGTSPAINAQGNIITSVLTTDYTSVSGSLLYSFK
jgi:hypothetical protein